MSTAQLTSDTKIAISLKKLQGKAHTKTENELYNEGLPSGITLDSSTVFGVKPPTNPGTSLGDITGNAVEKVRLTCTYIAGSDSSSGRHGFKLSLPSDYETSSTNPDRGNAPFTNSKELVDSNGLLQLVPPSYDYRYEAVPYYGTTGDLTSIPLADPRDWNLDYFNGVLFQQDPPGTGDHAQNPTYVDAYIYIGKYLDTIVDTHTHSGGGGGGGSSAVGADRYVHRPNSTTAALSNVQFVGLDTSTVPTNASLSVYLNGDYLLSGSIANVTAYSNADPRLPSQTNAHYYVSGTDTLAFGFAVVEGDILIVEKLALESASNKVQSLTAGTGLTGNATTGNVTLNVADLTVAEIAADSITAAGEAFVDNDTTLMTSAAINDLIESKGYTTEAGDITSVVAGTGLSGGGTTGDVTVNVSNLTLNEIDANVITTSGEAYADNDTTIMTSKAINSLIEGKGYTTTTGTVTSVGITAGNLVDVSGSPVTTNGNITVAVDLSELDTSTADGDGDFFVVVDDANGQKKLTKANIALSGFDNDSGFITGIPDATTTTKGKIEIATNAEATAGTETDKALVPSNLGSINVSTFSNDANYLTTVQFSNLHADAVTTSGESFSDDDVTVMTSAAINDLIESKGYTTVSGDITSVVAGEGLATGGTSGDVTVDVDYSGADNVIKSATDGTGITVDTENDYLLLHDATDDVVKYVKAGQVGGSGSGQIGAAEDGDYTDGLFTSFSPTTPTGTAVDKINEVLKLLAPSPAPDVKSINTTMANGINARLSFGTSNTGGATYVDSANSAGMTPVDTNGTYSATTEGTSERLGVFLTGTTIEGIVNHDVGEDKYANNVVNHVADAFGNGELGSLKLFVNDMSTPVHTLDLTSFVGAGNPGSGSGTSFTSNSGFYNISTKKDATSEGGTAFWIFKHRTAKYRIHPTHQREGFNYAKVVHSHSGDDKTTNYIEWINDTDTTSITATGTAVSNIVGSDEFILSGIKYFKTASFDYATTINNAHRAIHTTTPIVFNSQYGSITAATDQNSVNLLTTFPGVAVGQDFTKSITISSSGTFNVSHLPTAGLLNQGSTLSVNVVHPNTSKNETGIAATSVPNLLMWYTTSSSEEGQGGSENGLEDFKSETYRMQAGNYATQADVYTSGAYVTPWDSTVKVDSADAGHNTGLVCYQGFLKAPTNTLLSGNFASITNGPGSNADYSGITSGTRTYYRSFKKKSAGSVRDIRLTMRGSGTIIANGTPFGNSNNNFKVYIKVPGTTGWMDMATQFSLGNTGDNDGARVHTWTPNLATNQDRHNYASFGLETIDQNDFILVRIEADATWTGYIEKMVMKFGASSGSETSVPDACSSISCVNSNGVNAKLSFGASQSIPASDANHPYSNVAGTNGLASVDINNTYSSGGIKKGIYDGTVLFSGVVNSGEGGDADNFAAHSIRYGNEGTIKLYLNDALLHDIDLSSFNGNGAPGSGLVMDVNGAGSGFSNISTAAYVTWSDGIPDYRHSVRTMHWRVAAAEQRSGHNWVRVVHTVGATDYETNYIEWVNDENTDGVTFTNVNFGNFTDTDTSKLSGIEYFNSPSVTFSYRVNNMHKNVYSQSSTALGFIGLDNVSITSLAITGVGIQDPANVATVRTYVPPLLTNSDTNYTLPMDVTGTFDYDPTKNLPGTHGTSQEDVTINAKAYHPIKNTSGASHSASKTGLLVWTPVQSTSLAFSAPPTSEDFSGERYRIEDQSFPAASKDSSDMLAAQWDSTESLVGTNTEHNTGLCIYNGKLISPLRAGNSGDFTTGIQGPAGNVDYTGANNAGTRRTYLRAFYKTDIGDAATSITLSLTGTASLKSEGGNKGAFARNQAALGENTNVYIKVKFLYHSSQSPATKNTGWLDLGEASNLGAADGDACSNNADNLSDLNVQWSNNTNTVPIRIPTNRELLGTDNANPNYVIIKIEASEKWTGHFSALSVSSMS